jgi:hypothetical protein
VGIFEYIQHDRCARGPPWARGRCVRRAIAEAKQRFQRAVQSLLSRAPPYFGRHVKPLIPAAFVVSPLQFQGGLTSGRRPVVNITAESLSQHDEKHVVSTPLSGIRVGKRRSMTWFNLHVNSNTWQANN